MVPAVTDFFTYHSFHYIFCHQLHYYYHYFCFIPSVVKIPRVKSYKKIKKKTIPLVARGPNLVESCREEGLHYIAAQ